jgi:transposase
MAMPWKECSVVEERLRFVARLLDGAMTDVCREFGISRKTGYKIFDRYKEHGLEALSDRSLRPVRYANQLPSQVESLIVRLKRNKPHWGARKIPPNAGATSAPSVVPSQPQIRVLPSAPMR